ncbi:uncharacterized protein LOC111704353 [Eurytemora carolleeae]|uniref:uncharacterized protein LOC111704353 n=1 Tax=Eurytemora carolleeae TaxID=1294199 RepID=UPI000C785CA9|nr:uncharacterized protein LOC111704353 [Eurytemora carolleeae]|eukprot:XP_023332344.1 uncharacterized protein LOC111704353 [Eurytemora affinis]
MEVLPDHLLLKICGKLRFEDLRIVSVINSRLSRISLDPLLWARFPVSSDRILSNIQEFTSIRRFKKLRRLEISALRRRVLKPEDISTLFSYLSANTNIQFIRFSNLDLSSVPGFPFSQALVSVSSLSLQGCDLTTEQCIALLR